jgi:hypothetical protein
MPALRTRVGLGIAVITLFGAAPLAAAAERFQKVWCLRYAVAPQAPLSALHAGAPRDATLDLPFAMCVARSQPAGVLDSGYVTRSSASLRPRLGGAAASAPGASRRDEDLPLVALASIRSSPE